MRTDVMRTLGYIERRKSAPPDDMFSDNGLLAIMNQGDEVSSSGPQFIDAPNASLVDAQRRALQAALNSMCAQQPSPELESINIKLGQVLGTTQAPIGTIRAIKAVLSQHVWLGKSKCNSAN